MDNWDATTAWTESGMNIGFIIPCDMAMKVFTANMEAMTFTANMEPLGFMGNTELQK